MCVVLRHVDFCMDQNTAVDIGAGYERDDRRDEFESR